MEVPEVDLLGAGLIPLSGCLAPRSCLELATVL